MHILIIIIYIKRGACNEQENDSDFAANAGNTKPNG